MLENNNLEIILSTLEKKYYFLKWTKDYFFNLLSSISNNNSTKTTLLFCEEKIAKGILLDKQLENNIDLVKKYIKALSNDNNYNPVQKLRMLGLLFSNIPDIEENSSYINLIKDNLYLENIISDINEDDYNAIFEDKFAAYIFEDKQKYDEEENSNTIESFDTFKSGDDEFGEVIKSYKYLYPNILSNEEEKALLKKIKEGNKYAKEELVGHNWKLVLSITKKYLKSGIYIADLFQEGNIGLLKAIDRFDIEKGLKLSGYATWWINSAIQKYVDSNARAIRYPKYIEKKVYLVKKAYNDIKKKYGYEPSLEEVAEIVDMDLEEVVQLFNLPKVYTSLNQKIGEEDDEIEEFIEDHNALSPEDYTEKSVLVDEIKEYLDRLPEREAKIIKLRFGIGNIKSEGKTLEGIAKELGVTRERIRQIEQKALTRLKKCMQKPTNAIYNKNRYRPKTPRFIDNVYDYFKDYSKEEIDVVISGLSDIKREILEERFKEGGCSDETIKKFSYSFVNNFREKLIDNRKNEGNRGGKRMGRQPAKDIYEYFNKFSKEVIDEALEKLKFSDENKELLKKRFSEKEKPSADTLQAFSIKLAPRIKKKIKSISIKNEKEKNKEKLDTNIELISDKNENSKGSEESIIEQITEEEYNQINDLKTETLNTDNNININEIFKTPLFQEKTRNLPYESLIIVALKLGYFGGREYSSVDIASFLGVEVKTVNSIVTSTLEDYKKDIINMFYNVPNRSELTIDKDKSYVKGPSNTNNK